MRATIIGLLLILIFSISSSAKDNSFRYSYRVEFSDITIATAYNSLENQTDSTPWITAAGTRCREGVIAANHLPIGTKVLIDGFGDQIFTVEDRMNRRYTKRIDIWFRSYGKAVRFGKRKIKYYVLKS